MNCSQSAKPPRSWESARGRCDTGSAIARSTSSNTATESCEFGGVSLTGTWQVVRSKREPVMNEARKNRDFLKGPVWNPERNRWLVEIRYPDGSRLRKRLRREREALRIWSAEQAKIENGTWHEQAPKKVTFATALMQYREYSTVQNRSHHSYVEPALSVWEAHIKASTLLAKIALALIEDVKLRRAQDVAHTT